MDQETILNQTESYVRKTLAGEGSGHDWWHIKRVRRTALYLAQHEHVDLFIVQLAALLHDIADWKFHGGDDEAGPRAARAWLEHLHVNETIIAHVCEIIRDLSYKGAKVAKRVRTKEAMVVQDADRLDALGAIGIARAFAYGGYKGREIYNPEIEPEEHSSFLQYKQASGPTLNHFYEKLLLLKDLMNTEKAKQLAVKRHHFMEQFLEQFYQEWEGNI